MNIKRDLLIITCGRLITAVIGLLSIRAVTSFLPPEQYGQLAVLLVVQSFCGLFLVNPVGQLINRHTHDWWDSGTLFSRLNDYKKYIFLVSLIGGVATALVYKNTDINQIMLIAILMIMMVISNTWNATYIPMLNMIGKRAESVNWGLITSIASLSTSILLCSFWPTSISWFTGQIFGFSIGAIGAGLALRKGNLPNQNLNHKHLLTKQIIIAFCLPLALATGFMWLQLNGYRLIIKYYWGLETLAYLVVGLTLATQIWALVESLVQQFLYPFFYKRITDQDDKKNEALSDLLNTMVPIYIILAGITFTSAPYLLKLLVAPQYSNIDTFVRLGIVVEFCRVTGNILSNAAQATKRTRTVILPYALGATSVLALLSIVAILNLGIILAALCLAVSTLIMLASMWHAMYSEVKFHPDFKLWIIATFMATAISLTSLCLPKETLWFNSLAILSLISVIGLISLMLILRNNKALQRLLITTLQSKSI